MGFVDRDSIESKVVVEVTDWIEMPVSVWELAGEAKFNVWKTTLAGLGLSVRVLLMSGSSLF
jgi:hypothetical protein